MEGLGSGSRVKREKHERKRRRTDEVGLSDGQAREVATPLAGIIGVFLKELRKIIQRKRRQNRTDWA
jgi:hypothetical protein